MMRKTYWVKEVLVDPPSEAIPRKMNRAGSPTKYHRTIRSIGKGKVAVMLSGVLSRALSEVQQERLAEVVRTAIDVEFLSLVDELEFDCGMEISRDIPGREEEFTVTAHLRSEKIPVGSPEPPE